MPKLVEKDELVEYSSPTLVITGDDDIFFPAKSLEKIAMEVIPSLTLFKAFDMGHFPSEEHLIEINREIKTFLTMYY